MSFHAYEMRTYTVGRLPASVRFVSILSRSICSEGAPLLRGGGLTEWHAEKAW